MNRPFRYEIEKEVVDSLSELIRFHLKRAAYEQYSPTREADEMDHEIADGKKRATKLKAIRKQFEDVITGII
jgi:hypothetical protein